MGRATEQLAELALHCPPESADRLGPGRSWAEQHALILQHSTLPDRPTVRKRRAGPDGREGRAIFVH